MKGLRPTPLWAGPPGDGGRGGGGHPGRSNPSPKPQDSCGGTGTPPAAGGEASGTIPQKTVWPFLGKCNIQRPASPLLDADPVRVKARVRPETWARAFTVALSSAAHGWRARPQADEEQRVVCPSTFVPPSGGLGK